MIEANNGIKLSEDDSGVEGFQMESETDRSVSDFMTTQDLLAEAGVSRSTLHKYLETVSLKELGEVLKVGRTRYFSPEQSKMILDNVRAVDRDRPEGYETLAEISLKLDVDVKVLRSRIATWSNDGRLSSEELQNGVIKYDSGRVYYSRVIVERLIDFEKVERAKGRGRAVLQAAKKIREARRMGLDI